MIALRFITSKALLIAQIETAYNIACMNNKREYCDIQLNWKDAALALNVQSNYMSGMCHAYEAVHFWPSRLTCERLLAIIKAMDGEQPVEIVFKHELHNLLAYKQVLVFHTCTHLEFSVKNQKIILACPT